MNCVLFMTLAAKGEEVYRKYCQPVCKAYELSPTAFDVIMFLARNPGYNTARDVCRLRGIKSGIASVTVEQLIQRGLLTRCCDEHDRRIQRLWTTDAAEALIQQGMKAQQEFEDALLRGLNREDQDQFRRLSEKLMAHMDDMHREMP